MTTQKKAASEIIGPRLLCNSLIIVVITTRFITPALECFKGLSFLPISHISIDNFKRTTKINKRCIVDDGVPHL